MSAHVILLSIAAILVALTGMDFLRHGGGLTPKRRTWLLIAAIFVLVTLWARR